MVKNQDVTQLSLENLVELSRNGDKHSLEEIVKRIQDRIYGIALRMLFRPEDAEDATQEILIKIITHLDSFEGRSSFSTWAYRIATNHLLNARQRSMEKLSLSFEYFQDKGLNWLDSKPGNLDEGEMRVLANEVKLICTNVMLLALSREIRLAFIIGDVFGASSKEGAEILDITPEAFRQRLSRGRKQISDFMSKTCSLVHSDNPCKCELGIEYFINNKLLNPNNPVFSNHPCKYKENGFEEHPMHELDQFGRITAIYRSHPDYAAPEAFVGIVKKLVESGKFELFNNQ
jgi:RNA polymerase sigma factor (sigma-70 family)